MANVQEFLRDQLVKNEPRLCDIYYRDVLSLVSGRKIENEGVRLVSSRLNLVVGRMNAEGKKPLRKLGRLYVKIVSVRRTTYQRDMGFSHFSTTTCIPPSPTTGCRS